MIEYKTIIFDVDSTLVTIEGLAELAKHKGLNSDVEEITRLGMEGEITFAESILKRLEIVKPSLDDLRWLGEMYCDHLTNGAKETIGELKNIQKNVYLISGSFSVSLAFLGNQLGINSDHIFGLEINFDDEGKYLNFDQNQILVNDMGKKRTITSINPPHKIAFVGDGNTDLETQEVVDLFIGFGGVEQREVVKQRADRYIEENDLRIVLQYVQ